MERRTGGGWREGHRWERKGWRYKEAGRDGGIERGWNGERDRKGERKGWRNGEMGEEGMEEWGDRRGRDGGMERGTERQEGIAYRNQSFL